MQALYFLIFSFTLAVLLAEPVIALLIRFKSQQSFRELGPKSHIETKAGTPTMGAWIFLIPIFLVLIFLSILTQSKEIILVGLAFLIGTGIGAIDDALKILQSSYAGLSSINKLVIQFILSAIVVYFSNQGVAHFSKIFGLDSDSAFVASPFLLVWEYVWAFLVIAGSSNAINLTDGLDGLATGVSAISFMAIGILFVTWGEYTAYSLCLAIVGALLAFLLFNKKPARVFMGDTGSLALGMGLGTLAYVFEAELYLLVFALVPVIEALSVIIQVLSAKLSRKFLKRDWRPLKMAPLHHHFEECGMPEAKVVHLFWVVQFALAMFFLIIFIKL